MERKQAMVECKLLSNWVEALCALRGTHSDVVLVPSNACAINMLLRHSIDPELGQIFHLLPSALLYNLSGESARS